MTWLLFDQPQPSAQIVVYAPLWDAATFETHDGVRAAASGTRAPVPERFKQL
jgi:hypothetical protein